MTMLLLVHMSWGIGHVSPKYLLQGRLSGGTIETQGPICTNAPRFPCSNYLTVPRVIPEHMQVVQKVLSFGKGGALSSIRASFTGLAPSSCTLLKTGFPRITLSTAFHCARGISLYTHPPEMGHIPFHSMSSCPTSPTSFAHWAPRPMRELLIGIYFSLNIWRSQKSMLSAKGVRIMAVIFTNLYICSHVHTPSPCSSPLLSSFCTSQESAHSQIHFLCPHPGCLHMHRPLTHAHAEPKVVKAT